MIIGFDCAPRTRMVFGAGALRRLGELARDLGLRRPLLVTDAGLVSAGHVDRARRSLAEAGVDAVVYDRVRENPTCSDVDLCVEAARDAAIDGFIGFGGGSSMDTAKGCNFLLTNGGEMKDYLGYGKAARPMLPLIAVPTTAGTGSECQSYALIAEDDTHHKMACGDPKAAARIALLDPELTLSQPPHVTACTGIDAMAHAVETTVTKARNEISLLYSREAFRLIAGHLERVLEEPEDLEARAAMQLGAAYAGLAIENSMLGAAHSAANPLTAHFDIVHGQAVGLMLPHVIRFNAAEPEAANGYRDLALRAGLANGHTTPEQAVEALAGRLESVVAGSPLPSPLPSTDSLNRLLPSLADEAAGQWTARFNPREASSESFAALYRSALCERPAPAARLRG